MSRSTRICFVAIKGKSMRFRDLAFLATLAFAVFAVPGFSSAQGSSNTAEADISVRMTGTRLYFEADPDYFNYTLRVTGPNEYVGEIFSARRPPSFRLGDHGSVADGIYRYEISAATREYATFATPRAPGADGRSASSQQPRVGVVTGGSFRVLNGQILVSSETESET